METIKLTCTNITIAEKVSTIHFVKETGEIPIPGQSNRTPPSAIIQFPNPKIGKEFDVGVEYTLTLNPVNEQPEEIIKTKGKSK